MSQEPTGEVIEIPKPKHCRNCHCLLFPLTDGQRLDCPICHPEASFANNTYKFSRLAESRKLIIFVFDITIPLNSLLLLLNDLYNNITDNETISLICVSDRIVFITVVDGLVVLETYTHHSEIATTIRHSFSRQTLKNVVLPSISSVLALKPDTFANVYDYYEIFKIACKISNSVPFTLFLFSNRHCAPINADDAQFISEMVKENNSIAHIGCINEFKRFTAAARCTFGKVFSVSMIPAGGYFSKLTEKNLDKFRLFAPSSFEYTKVTNSSGNLRMSEVLSKLKLRAFSGGSVRMSFNPTRTSFKTLRILEESRTNNGTFLSLYTFNVAENLQKFKESANQDILNTLILKGFASDVLRGAWNGDKFDQVLPKFLPAVKDMLNATTLHNMGTSEQIDIIRLYYVLGKYGITDISARLVKLNGGYALVVPPTLYILTENDNVDYSELYSSFEWPIEIKLIQNKSAFQFTVEKFGIKFTE